MGHDYGKPTRGKEIAVVLPRVMQWTEILLSRPYPECRLHTPPFPLYPPKYSISTRYIKHGLCSKVCRENLEFTPGSGLRLLGNHVPTVLFPRKKVRTCGNRFRCLVASFVAKNARKASRYSRTFSRLVSPGRRMSQAEAATADLRVATEPLSLPRPPLRGLLIAVLERRPALRTRFT